MTSRDASRASVETSYDSGRDALDGQPWATSVCRAGVTHIDCLFNLKPLASLLEPVLGQNASPALELV